MNIIHFSANLGGTNGMANTARQFVAEELTQGHDSRLTNQLSDIASAGTFDVLHIHGTWLPVLWKASKLAKRAGAKVINRPAGNYDPIRLRRGLVSRLKKWAVGPWEHAMLDRADVLQATCDEEAEWICAYHPGAKGKVEQTDLKRFFKLDAPPVRPKDERHQVKLNVLYLGRRDPLKGVEFLEQAVEEVEKRGGQRRVELRIVSDHTGEELEADWNWADVLCLPTLTENFGRVVAEALERGRRVITTDGAPAWRTYFEQHPDAGFYLKGYRDGNEETRVKLLADALKWFVD